MDIEAIRTQCKYLPGILDNPNDAVLKRLDTRLLAERLVFCINHIDEIESRLRWKKVEEEKPPFHKEFLVKSAQGFVWLATLKPSETGIGYGYWIVGNDERAFNDFTEWREI